MPQIAAKPARSSLAAVLIAVLSSAALAWLAAASQNSHAGPVTGVVDGVAFEGGQYYVHSWACQEGNRGSIEVRREPEGSWSYQYFSLIDPKSTDPSFMTITDNPYLYYVRMEWQPPSVSTNTVPAKGQIKLASAAASEDGRDLRLKQRTLKESSNSERRGAVREAVVFTTAAM